MRRSSKTSLLATLAVLALGSTAKAASITTVDISPAGPGAIHAPSDLVSVDVLMDSEGMVIASYFFHVGYEPGLSVVMIVPYGPYPYPTGSSAGWIAPPPCPTVDEYGVYLCAYAAGGKSRPGPFTNTWITTIIFHVADPGDGNLAITPYFEAATGDLIGDANNQDVSPLFELNSTTIHTPEPTTALLFALGLLTIGYAARRQG